MESFTAHEGLVAPLPRSNVDTDAILPKQYLKMMQRTGFGRYLFDEWRYLDPGLPGDDCSTRRPNPDFVLNQARYQGASILLTGANFGCGSSREHAPWALREFGLRAIVAPGFADIFAINCVKNGLALIALPPSAVDTLFAEVEANPGYTFAIDLPTQILTEQNGRRHAFEFDAFRKRCLLQGLSEIELGLQQAQAIRAYEQRRVSAEPWVFAPMG